MFLHGEENDKEYCSIIRGMIVHEDGLTNQRLTWMTTLNGLMLAALGVMLGVIWQKEYHVVLWKHYAVAWAFCLFGIVICVSSWLTLMSAHLARNRLKELWVRRFQLQKWDPDKPKESDAPPRYEAIPPLSGWFDREEDKWTEEEKKEKYKPGEPHWEKPFKGIWEHSWVMYLLPWTILPVGLGVLWFFLLVITIIDFIRRHGS
jgi:hypothetical protein